MFLFDAHCDTATRLCDAKQLFDNDLHISIEKLKCMNQAAQVFAIYLGNDNLLTPFKTAVEYIDYFKSQVEINKDHISIVNNSREIIDNCAKGKISAILALEGAEPLEGDLENIYKFHEMGVKLITLTWSRKNQLGDGYIFPKDGKPSELGKGLRTFGKQVVKTMNELSMVVDVSHLSVAGFWDVCELSTKPFVASHSNAFEICKHGRNLTDEQIKALAKAGGVMGINLYPPFLNESEISTIDDVFKHIDYILSLVGDDYVGLGGDFDGIDCVTKGLENVSCYANLYELLVKKYGNVTANKIFGENFLRVFA